jgi:hypothetical protein
VASGNHVTIQTGFLPMPDPITERRGVNAVEAIFLDEFGWYFREQTVSDVGIDAQVEVVEHDKATGKLIALQIKTGSSYFRKHGSDYIYYGEQRHLDYWLGHSLPVFLILHDPDRKLTLWQKVERHLARATDNGWSIIIPAGNTLSTAFKEAIAAGIPTDLPSIRRARMAMDLDLMRQLVEEEEIYFEIEHWVNKSLGMRGIAIMYNETEKDKPDATLDFMYPVRSYEHLMVWWFPWLNYKYIQTRETMSDEIDIEVLHVSVNDLGKSFIAVEGYFAEGVSDPEPPEWHGAGAP